MVRLHIVIAMMALLCEVGQAAPPLKIPPAYRQVADEYRVPPRLLFAIALTESGRRGKPWPWTMNVEGRPYYFPTRAAAENALRRWLTKNKQPDVGLMEVNWRYHRQKLQDHTKALDPWYNLRAGALILRQAYDATGDWWRAAGRYHSTTPSLASIYRQRVRRWWRRIEE
ncbi:MAG TPA: lytic transglycosylase domain-containing protein [Rhodobacteraceae bacterium]|nr:lytic transglycosylase domain-containing protein [Paracoccaceae bacterium]